MSELVLEICKEYSGDNVRVVVIPKQIVDEMAVHLPGNHAWLGLQVDAFASGTDPSFGWGVSYLAHRIELERAEAVVRVLRGIHKHLDKLAKAGGVPESFGQYVLRVAAYLGITRFVMTAIEWNEEDQWLDAQGACAKINCILHDYHVQEAKQIQ